MPKSSDASAIPLSSACAAASSALSFAEALPCRMLPCSEDIACDAVSETPAAFCVSFVPEESLASAACALSEAACSWVASCEEAAVAPELAPASPLMPALLPASCAASTIPSTPSAQSWAGVVLNVMPNVSRSTRALVDVHLIFLAKGTERPPSTPPGSMPAALLNSITRTPSLQSRAPQHRCA